jgi:hypothetical protein
MTAAVVSTCIFTFVCFLFLSRHLAATSTPRKDSYPVDLDHVKKVVIRSCWQAASPHRNCAAQGQVVQLWVSFLPWIIPVLGASLSECSEVIYWETLVGVKW